MIRNILTIVLLIYFCTTKNKLTNIKLPDVQQYR